MIFFIYLTSSKVAQYKILSSQSKRIRSNKHLSLPLAPFERNIQPARGFLVWSDF